MAINIMQTNQPTTSINSGYNRLFDDSCFLKQQTNLNNTWNDYHLQLNAVMRPGVAKASALGDGAVPDFYGPLRGNKVSQDSYIARGLGQVESRCGSQQVDFLPKDIFPDVQAVVSTERTDLQPNYSKNPKSCNGLAETDTTSFAFFPEHFKRSYLGPNPIPDVFVMQRYLPELKPNKDGKSYGTYVTSVIAPYN